MAAGAVAACEAANPAYRMGRDGGALDAPALLAGAVAGQDGAGGAPLNADADPPFGGAAGQSEPGDGAALPAVADAAIEDGGGPGDPGRDGAASGVDAASLTNGLVAHFPMDEAAGSQLADATGGPALTLRPTATWIRGRTGAIGDGAVAFSSNGWAGTDPRASSAAVSALRTSITIAFWLRWDGPRGTDQTVIVHGYRDWDVRLGTTVFPRVCFGVGDGLFGTCGRVDLPLQRWVHVAITWDGATVRNYVDGIADPGMSASFTGTLGNRGTGYLDLAAWGGGDPLMGALDDVRVYARALSASEIALLAGR